MSWRVHRKKTPREVKIPTVTKVAFGGVAGMAATTIVQPLDVIKVRMQLCQESYSIRNLAAEIIEREGVRSLYSGLSAGLLRQATYTTTRLAVFNWLYDEFKDRKLRKNPGFGEKVLIGAYAGLAGGLAGNPSELVLVRLMAHGPNPCSPNCKQYKGTMDAFYRIFRTGGVCALWRGTVFTLARSVFVSTAQIASYTMSREELAKNRISGFRLHVYSSIISSLITSLISLPVDHLKTRYQVTKVVGQTALISQFLKNERLLILWSGFVPYFLRMTVHTFVTFLILEVMNEYYKKYVKNKEN